MHFSPVINGPLDGCDPIAVCGRTLKYFSPTANNKE